jgi:hypothetical protein
MESFIVWLIATALIVGVFYLGRGALLQRQLRLGDLNLAAAIIFAGVIATVPAFFVSQMSRSTAVVPADVADAAAVVAGAPKTKD